MAKKKSPNELYWEAKVKAQIREKYEEWLSTEEKENTPHNAHVYALKTLAGSYDYMGMNERELILFLAGALPKMYD